MLLNLSPSCGDLALGCQRRDLISKFCVPYRFEAAGDPEQFCRKKGDPRDFTGVAYTPRPGSGDFTASWQERIRNNPQPYDLSGG